MRGMSAGGEGHGVLELDAFHARHEADQRDVLLHEEFDLVGGGDPEGLVVAGVDDVGQVDHPLDAAGRLLDVPEHQRVDLGQGHAGEVDGVAGDHAEPLGRLDRDADAAGRVAGHVDDADARR